MPEEITQQNTAARIPVFDLTLEQAHEDVSGVISVVLEGPTFEAAKFAERLERLVAEQRDKLRREMPHYLTDYENWILNVSYYGLPHLSDSKVIKLVNEHGLAILKAGIDLREQLRIFLAKHYTYEERNKLRMRLVEALATNKEVLGGAVPGNDDKSSQIGTVASWLMYRNRILGPASESDIVRETAFLAQDQSVRNLNPTTKDLLGKLLKLYKWLHYSSLWPEGHENHLVIKDVAGLKILQDGVLVELEDIPIVKDLGLTNIEDKVPFASPTKVAAAKPVETQRVSSPVSAKEIIANSESASAVPYLSSTPQVIKSPSPALIFDMEDEKEADKHRSKSKSIEEREILEKQIRVFVDEIIKKNNLAFKDEVNERRFVQLMVSRLKDVRGPLEIAEALRKPTESGGLGLPDDKAERVQAIVEAAKKEFETRIKNNELRITEPEPEQITPTVPVKPLARPATYDVEAAKAWREQMLQELQSQTEPTPMAPTSAPSTPTAQPRPQLTDVKAPPKVVGPLEELRSLGLNDFRRLGTNATEALQKIRGKIDLLGETSLARRVEAVKAWKSSAVYQQYLKLGRESIEQGKPVSFIVGSHQSLGEPVLSEDEFTAIADFNARLRF